MSSEWRRILEDVLVLGALAYLSASNFDKTEIRLVTAYGAYLAGRTMVEYLPKKRSGYSWPEVAAASALILFVGVKCAHDVVTRYWITVADSGGLIEMQKHLEELPR